VATRRIDLENTLPRQPKSGPAEKPERESTGNRVARHSVEPVAPSRSSSIDPSPFSKPQVPESGESREERIARAAYQRAERRGFAPGQEVEDWLAAEREIDGESARG
jgi:hypothetical protein